jgi:hypothetical protein
MYDVKKKNTVLLIALFLVDLLSVINFVYGFNYNIIYFNTNQTSYFIDENIKINASWELNYNSNNEISYVQIHIFDNCDNIIWNSSKYNQNGIYQKNWTVNTEQFNLDSNNGSYIYFVRFVIFYFHRDTQYTMYTYLETIKIRVIKRNLLCQLIGYRNYIKIGENISFVARFYDESTESNDHLSNQTIEFKISCNDKIIYQQNYTLNMSGSIYLHLSSSTQLELGKNILTFSIVNNRVFNNTVFTYNLYVEENQGTDYKIYSSIQMRFVSLISVLIIVLFLLSYIIIHKKNETEKLLTEITIRY